MTTVLQEIAALPLDKQQQFLDDLTPEETYALLYDWQYSARPEQLTPMGNWSIHVILSGRGWGKTRTAAEDVKAYGLAHPKSRIAVIAPTFGDARDTCIEGESGLLSILPPDKIAAWNRSLGELVLTNGARYKIFSAAEPERLRGPQNHRAWWDELCASRANDIERSWHNLMFGLRLGKHPQLVVTTTPKPLRFLRELVSRPDVIVTRGSTFENTANLPETALAEFKARYSGTRVGRQELLGEILDDIEGALWTREQIESAKVRILPEMRRIVVAVDPAITAGEDSDMTGIAVVGLGVDGICYVLYSEGVRMSPDAWARRVVGLYHLFEADRIIAEVNQGGDLVVSVIRTVEKTIPVKIVRASRGKLVRAEPVAALWEQGRVKLFIGEYQGKKADHVLLEDQMCSYTGLPGEESPDVLDAKVYAVSELALGTNKVGGMAVEEQEEKQQAAGVVSWPLDPFAEEAYATWP